MTEKLALDWTSAEVSDGTLVVALSAKPPKKWRDAFARATALLSHGNWSTRLTQRNAAVRLDPVELGEEERVRQFLEGALLEANRTIVSEDELFAAGEHGDEEDEPEASVDEELTQKFRSFATR
jgi:hypothetical protein